MPTYQYACTECDHRFEAVQSFSDDALTTCPECQGRLRKVFSAVGVVFKGSGFYRTDSRGTPKGEGAPKESGKDSAKDATAGAGTGSGGAKEKAAPAAAGSGSGSGGSSGGSSAPASTGSAA